MISHPSRIPIATLLLITANIVAAFALTLQPGMVDYLGFRSDKPSFITALSSLFLHQNILHLLGNMIFLAAVGVAVELATGSLRFLATYFLSGFAGVLAHMLFAGGATPLIGASGCVAGCAAYYSARYIGLRVPLLPKVSISVATVTGIWVALQALGAFVHLGSSSSVSFWSHLGGFLMGLILSIAFTAPDLGQRALGHQVLDEMNQRGPAAVLAAAKRHLDTHPRDPIALSSVADAASAMGDREEEAGALLALLDVTPESQQRPVLLRLFKIGALQRLPALHRTLLAERFKASDEEMCEVLLISVVSERIEEPQRPEAMLALVGLKWEKNPSQAKKILAQLAESYPLHATVGLARQRGWLS